MNYLKRNVARGVVAWLLVCAYSTLGASTENKKNILLDPATSTITFDIKDYYTDFNAQSVGTPSSTFSMKAGWLQTTLVPGASVPHIVEVLVENISMPESLKTVVQGIKSFNDLEKFSNLAALGQNIFMRGIVEYADGSSAQVQVIQVDQTADRPAGFVLMIELPTHVWKPSQFNEDLKEFDAFNYILVLTTFPFADSQNKYAVQAGAALVGVIELDKLLPSTSLLFEDLKKVETQFSIKTAAMMLSLNGGQKKPFFKGQLKNLLTSDIRLPDVVDASSLSSMRVSKEIADKAGQTLFSGVVLKNPLAYIECGVERERLMITGRTLLWGKDLSAQIAMSKEGRKKTGRLELENREKEKLNKMVTFQVQLSQAWQISDIIPSLAGKIKFEFNDATVIASSLDDDELNIRKGLHFEGMLPISKLPSNFVTNTLQAAFGKDKLVKIIAFVAVRQEGELFDYGIKMMMPLIGNKELKVGDLLKLDKQLVPQSVINEVNKVSFKDPYFILTLENTYQSAVLEGLVAFNGYEGVKARLLIFNQSANMEVPEGIQKPGAGSEKQTEDSHGVSLVFTMPAHKWKISDTIKELKFFDSIETEQGAIVIAQAQYYDFDLREHIAPGLTLLVDWFLVGKLAPLQKLYDSTLGSATVAADKKKPFRFKGEVNPTTLDCSLQVRLPAQLKLDFKDVDVVKEGITSMDLKDFIFAVGRDGTDIGITGGATAGILTPFQPKPFEQQMFVGVESSGAFVLEVRRSELEFNFLKWLKIEKSGIKLKVIPPGLPTDIEIRGGVRLGDITMNTAFKIGKDGWAVDGELDKFSLDSTVRLVELVVGKTTHVPNIPPLGINNVKMHIVPKDTEVAGLPLSAGINIEGTIEVLSQKAQLKLKSSFPSKDMTKGEKALALIEGIYGSVVLKEINIKDALVISGKGLPSTTGDGTFIKGPMFVVSIGLAETSEQKIELDGTAKILSFANAEVHMQLTADGFKLKTEVGVLGAKGLVEGQVTTDGLNARMQIVPQTLPYLSFGNMQGQLVVNKDVQSATLDGNIGFPFMGTSTQAKIIIGLQGASFTGAIVVLGGLTQGALSGSITSSGFQAQADLSGVAVPISMTNAKLSITATDKEQRGVIDGMVGIPVLKTSAQTQIMLDSKSGGTFTLNPTIFGMSGGIACSINSSGVTGSGKLSPLINPLFSITSADGQAGPSVSFTATKAKQAANLTGQAALNIPGLQVAARQAINIDLSSQGFALVFSHKIFNMFESTIALSGAGDIHTLDVDNLTVDITLKQSAADVLKNEFTKFADIFKKNVDSAADVMRKEFSRSRDELKQRLQIKRKECGI